LDSIEWNGRWCSCCFDGNGSSPLKILSWGFKHLIGGNLRSSPWVERKTPAAFNTWRLDRFWGVRLSSETCVETPSFFLMGLPEIKIVLYLTIRTYKSKLNAPNQPAVPTLLAASSADCHRSN
jgi:hypothetical protein